MINSGPKSQAVPKKCPYRAVTRKNSARPLLDLILGPFLVISGIFKGSLQGWVVKHNGLFYWTKARSRFSDQKQAAAAVAASPTTWSFSLSLSLFFLPKEKYPTFIQLVKHFLFQGCERATFWTFWPRESLVRNLETQPTRSFIRAIRNPILQKNSA